MTRRRPKSASISAQAGTVRCPSTTASALSSAPLAVRTVRVVANPAALSPLAAELRELSS
ncbi:hypothetical protein ACIQM3_31985 [Streptomyces sp. NPDC091271]|uniref:hypothetical protein n=1 Tax=Streptomyces sp. NPDC091271 TaxID=3365980 RepID=UPI003807AAB5